MAALVAAGSMVVVGGSAQAEPPRPPTEGSPLPPGWQIDGADLVWQASKRVPMGDAAVEFYAGDRLLGRPRAARDGRTFRLDLTALDQANLSTLEARAGGRRLDAPAGAPRSRSTTPAPLPAQAPLAAVDPGKPGPYKTVMGEYTLPGVRLPGFPAPVEMVGVVVAPKGASGKRPLALFLHGRHSTCYKGEESSGDWPCPRGWRSIPSHRGYLTAQRLLASQGYVTVSISANGINGQDYAAADGGAQARSSLVRQHLARWATWAGAGRAGAPGAVRTAPRADLSRVLLVGHSRGGEGVNRAAMDSLSPPPAAQDGYRGPVRWRIRGTVLIGPTIFGHNPAPDVPSLTVLPGCDGDVFDLQGEVYVDGTRGVSRGAALHGAVYMVGANHNFYNSEWTPGQAAAPAWDDFWSEEPDPVCTPNFARTRLTPTQQQAAGATYYAAAARLFVGGDDRVRPLIDGSNVRPASAGPARVLSHAVGAARTALLVPDATTTVTGAGARLCPQVASDPAVACLGEAEGGGSPHFVPFGFISPDPDRYAVALTWSAPGTPARIRPARQVFVAGATSVALRIVVPPNTKGTTLDVAVTDTAGRRSVLGQVRLDGLPGTGFTTSYWGQEVRVPLRAGVDASRIAALELVPRSASGKAWLVDAWGWRPGTPDPRPVPLPRVDFGPVSTVDEGDSGVRTYRVPVTVSGWGGGQVRLYLYDSTAFEVTSRVVTLTPGTRTIDIPVEVRGNTRFNYDAYHVVAAKALRGVAVGAYEGGLIVLNDDPMPAISVAPVADRVTEGASLTWRVTLSEPADADIFGYFAATPPASGPELSSTDVDPEWFEQQTFESPLPSRPLSSANLYVFVIVPAGELTAEFSVPTIADALAEPPEYLRLQPESGPDLVGTVTDPTP
ncbi:hypothetical protein GCM10023263_68650 [Phytohabitans rumicis]